MRNLIIADPPARPGAWPSLSAEDRFARVVEAVPTALVLIAPDGRIELINRQAERMFGYDRAELHGELLEVLMPERFRRAHPGLRRAFLADMSPRMMGEDRELLGLRKDGSEFPIEVGLNPMVVDDNTMVLAGIIDVTARRENEQARKQQRTELERSNADLEEFAYAVSHDLKAPLRGIAHLAQWIGEDVGAAASPETAENIKLLQGRVTRLQMLLDGMLAYARAGRADSTVEPVDVAEMVRDIAALLAPKPGFTIAFDGPCPPIRTYRAPLHTVLENLISNALKHHDRDAGRISVSMRLADGEAEIRVADDGPGIAQKFHDRIFVIFQTLARRDEVETSGIGLAIVKKRITDNGGRIRVESAPPARGTTFVFTWKEATP